jgi:hypothetical protein
MGDAPRNGKREEAPSDTSSPPPKRPREEPPEAAEVAHEQEADAQQVGVVSTRMKIRVVMI